MADDLSDFQPVAAATPAHDVSDFQPVSSPIVARSPASTSDLSDFEPAESNKVVDPKKAATMFSGIPVEAGPHKFTGENQYGTLFTPPEITPKDIERVSPILSAVNPLFGVTHGLLPRTTNVATSGAANVVSGFANMLNSDEGLLMLGTGGLPKAAQSAVGLAFAAHAIKDSPEAVSEFVSAKTDEDRSKALTRILNNFAIGGGGILHGFGRPVPKTPGAETPPAPTGKHAEIVNTARNEMRRAADETSKEVEPVLSKLPGDTQDRVRGIIAKQASGTELSPDERATLIQVQSFASRTAQGQTAEQFTAPTESPPASTPAAGAAASTSSDIQGGSSPAKGNLFAQAKQEAAAKVVAPLVESAQAASDVAPAAAEAAEQAAAVIAEKTSEPKPASTQPSPKEINAAAYPFLDALRKAREKEQLAKDLGSKEAETEAASERRKAEDDLIERFGTDSEYELQQAITDRLGKGTHTWENGRLKRVSSPTAEVEPPATTGQAGAPTEAAKGRPSEEVPPATGAAGVKPETKTAGTKIAGPAIIDDTGKVISRGEVGSSHADLKAGEIEKGNTTAADAKHVFLDDHGNVLDREQAWELAKKSGQINPDTLAAQQRGEVAPELHSENLVNAAPTGADKFDAALRRDREAYKKDVESRPIEQQPPRLWYTLDAARTKGVGPGELTFEEISEYKKKWQDAADAAVAQDKPIYAGGKYAENPPKRGWEKRDDRWYPPESEPLDPAAPAPKTDTRKFKPEAIPDVLKELEEEKPAPTPEPEPAKTEGPTPPPIDKDAAATASRGIPGALGDAVRDVLLNDKSVEEAAAANGTTVKKVQDSVDRMRQYLSDKAAKIAEEPKREESTTTKLRVSEDDPRVLAGVEEESRVKFARNAVDRAEAKAQEQEKKATDAKAYLEEIGDQSHLRSNAKHEARSSRALADAYRKDVEKAQQALDEARKWKTSFVRQRIQAEVDTAAPEIPVEPTAPKTPWQRTRDEVAQVGDSLAAHRLAVRKAIGEGQAVPLEVLEDFKGSPWADKAREKLYGQQISDTLLGKILKGLTDEGNTLYSDPLFINSVGKPVLRAAVKILQEGIESGKLAGDAITDALGYLREHIPNLNEDKANEFFDQFFEKPDETTPQPQPESPSVETPSESREQLPSGEEAPPPPRTEDSPVDPRATNEEGQRVTSTKNAVVDAERKARGEPELMSEAAKSLGATWDEASRQVDLNREAGPNLVKELNGKPRTIGAVEEAILLHHKIDVMNDLSKNTEVALDANADPGDRAEARMTAARLMDQLNDIDEVTRKAGTEWGRTGRFRQVLAAEDYSLAKMLQRSELAKGRPLTEEEQVKVQQMSTRIADLEKKLAEHEQQADVRREQAKNADADKAIEEMKKPVTEADKYSQGILDRIRQGLQSQEDKAWERIRARLGRASAGVDPTVLYDVAVIGANRLFKTGLDFAKWSSEMARTFADTLGDTITPHLQEIFDQSKKINEDAIDKAAPKELRAKLKTKPADDAEARTRIVQTIANRSKAKESLGGQIKKLAENFVRNGITERDTLVAAVHDAVKEALPEATTRDIRDAISGYGEYRELSQDEVQVKMRDLKGQMQQISKIEDLTGKGPTGKPKLPDPTGAQRRTKTAEERVLEQEVNRIKKESGLEQTDPRSLKGAMDAVKARLKNRIEDLQLAISKKEKLPAKGKKLADDPETEQLRRDKDALQKEYDDFFAEPKLTPDQIALKVYKTRTAKRIADLQDRLARKDFSTKPRKLVPLDAEGFKLKTDAERAKLEFDRGAYKDQQANRPTWEKIIDYIPKLSRATLLSSPLTLAKLTAAAMWRMSVTPIEELIGAGLGKLPFVSDIAARAPREAGFSANAEARALTDAVTLGMKDAYQKLFRGDTDLDVTGGKRSIIPHELIDVFGNIHGALKAPVVRAEFARSFEKRAQFAIANGIDVTDPMVLTRLQVESYKDAQRAIFMQDNRVVSAWSSAMKQFGLPSKVTGRPTVGGKVAQAFGKTLLPIVKIPTNIVAEAFQYATGAVTGSTRLAAAMKRGVDTLKPEEADLIMRELKKGSLGGAVMLLGFLAPQVIGGYYQQGQKRKDSDVKAGGVRLYGANIPPMLLHNPAVEMLQVGATVRRVADSKLRKKDRYAQGIPAGVLAAGLGLIQEVPFVNETTQISKVFNPQERTQFFGELARSRMEPQAMQWLAQQGDKRGAEMPEALLPWKGEVRQRKPENFKDEMKVGIPGLRKTVPLKKKALSYSR